MTRSHDDFQAACRHIPGGVNSPVRAFRGVGGDPVFFASGEGPCLVDVDGKRYKGQDVPCGQEGLMRLHFADVPIDEERHHIRIKVNAWFPCGATSFPVKFDTYALTGRVSILFKPPGDRIRLEIVIQHVGPQPGQEGMGFHLLRRQYRDVRGAIEQGAVGFRVQGDAQAAPGIEQTVALHREPASVELIVAVQREIVVESRQHGLATGIHGSYPGAGDVVLEAAEFGKGEIGLLDLLPDQHVGQAIRGPSNFGALRHGRSGCRGSVSSST